MGPRFGSTTLGARHTALVIAVLAVCVVTAALLRRRIDTRALAPFRPDQPPPADLGLIPLTRSRDRTAARSYHLMSTSQPEKTAWKED